jgi:hypothetical protein
VVVPSQWALTGKCTWRTPTITGCKCSLLSSSSPPGSEKVTKLTQLPMSCLVLAQEMVGVGVASGLN